MGVVFQRKHIDEIASKLSQLLCAEISYNGCAQIGVTVDIVFDDGPMPFHAEQGVTIRLSSKLTAASFQTKYRQSCLILSVHKPTHNFSVVKYDVDSVVQQIVRWWEQIEQSEQERLSHKVAA